MPPTVPLYDTPQVAPAGLPGVQLQGLSPRQLMQGEIQGHEQEAAGQAVQNLATQNMDEQAKENMIANQTRVDAAANELREQQQNLTSDPDNGFLAKKGVAAINPVNGQGLAQQYGQKLSDAASQISSSLSNDAQRQAFARQAAQIQTQFNGQIQSHVLQQKGAYQISVQQGTVDLAKNDAINNWMDPKALSPDGGDQSESPILNAVQSAQNAVRNAGLMTDKSASEIAFNQLQVGSGIHRAVIEAALENNNLPYAKQYFDKFNTANDMTGNDRLAIQKQLGLQGDAQMVTGKVQNVIAQAQQAAQPSDITRMQQITRQSESGNNPGATGPYIEGQGTAKGVNQVMDATSLNPGYGVKPAQDNSPAERARVGNDYLQAMLTRYMSDPAKAWAAYNAGPGTVDQAIKDAGPDGDWMAALANHQSPANHAQTVAYVNKNMDALKLGGGLPVQPSLEAMRTQLRADPDLNQNPRLMNMALVEMERQNSDMLKDRKSQADNLEQQAQTYLIQNKWDFNSLPQSLVNDITQYAPAAYPRLQAFAQSGANPKQTDNDQLRLSLFNNPQGVAAMSNAEWTSTLQQNFTKATQEKLQSFRQEIQSGNLKGPDTVDYPAFHTELTSRLKSLGLVDAKGVPADADQVAGLTNAMHDVILDRQKNTGIRMNSDQIAQLLDNQFAKTSTIQHFWGGTSTQPITKTSLSDISSTNKELIKAAWKDRGVANPTDAQILQAYYRNPQ